MNKEKAQLQKKSGGEGGFPGKDQDTIMALVMLNARAGQSCQVMVKGERDGTGPESGASPGRKWKE